MTLIGSIFDDGEVYIQSLLSQLSKPEIWNSLVNADGQEVGNTPCPLVYSDRELKKQAEDLARWEKDVERKAGVIQEVGTYTGWDGVVSPDEYSLVSEKLEKVKERFLDAESKTVEEREQWANAWPFRDHGL